MKKESLTQVFSCELCKIFNNLSYKTPPVAVSDLRTSYKNFQKTAIWKVKLHPRLIFWGALSPLWVSFYQKDNLICYLVIVTKVFCFTPTFSFKLISLGQAFRFQQAKYTITVIWLDWMKYICYLHFSPEILWTNW